MRTIARLLIGFVVASAVAYFGYIAVEASHRSVSRYEPWDNDDCRTPAQLGIAYEAVNYDISADAELAAREADMLSCSEQGAAPGDELVSSDGVRLAAWYVPAASGVGPEGPTVVMSHGWTDNKSGLLENLVFFHQDYNAVLFDFRNHGQSAASPITQGILEQRDLAAVLDWLVANKDPDTIVLWGQSMGGHTAVNVAADDPRVDAVILDSLHSRVTVPMAARIENEGYPFGQAGALATVAGIWVRTGVNVLVDDPITAVAELGSRPVLLLSAGSDDTIPVADGELLREVALAAGVDLRLEVCPAAGHAEVSDACPADYQRWVDEFMARVAGS